MTRRSADGGSSGSTRAAPPQPDKDADAVGAVGAGGMKGQEEAIGGRVREARQLRGLKLQRLAELAGCSISALSKIENGRANPSLGLLNRICSALGMNISTFFEHREENPPVVTPSGQRRFLDTAGVRFERLIPRGPGHMLQGHLTEIDPGHYSQEALAYPGEEVGYVIEGVLELAVDGTKHTARAGDSFFFSSTLPHSFGNPGTTLTRVVWVNTPPISFEHRQKRSDS